jgi:uncharacterized protein with NRDE domain
LLAGKDKKAGGTWLALNSRGWLAAVTNIRSKQSLKESADLKSRGQLILRLLDYRYNRIDNNADSLNAECAELANRLQQLMAKEIEEYSAFNLLAWDLNTRQPAPLYATNAVPSPHHFTGGSDDNDVAGGISNSILSEACSWPKVQDGKRRLESIVAELNAASNTQPNNFTPTNTADVYSSQLQMVKKLFQMLTDCQQPYYDDSLLPTNTGLPVENERHLSTIYVRPVLTGGQHYGTRSSTVILVDRNGQVDVWERTHSPQSIGSATDDTVHLSFQL